MEIKKIIALTNARIVAGDAMEVDDIEKAFSSDLMSDVLTLDEHSIILITGLANVQLLRTVEMADIPVVMLARNKKSTPEMIQLAKEIGVLLLETPFSIFRASGILYTHGIKPVY